MSSVPPDTVTSALLWIASSSVSISNVPPDIVSTPSAFIPLYDSVLSPVVFSDEPPPALKVNVPSFMSTVPDASMQSLPLVMFSVPPEIYTYPFSVSSVFLLCIPSVPDVTVILPPAILMLSLPERPCDAEVMLYVPPVILRSSFVTMPCLLSHFTFRVPLPLKVISDFENIAPSTFAASSDEANLPVLESVFSVPFTVVINTLSAFII